MIKKKLVLFTLFILLVLGFLTYQSVKGKGRVVDFPTYPLKIFEQALSAVIKGISSITDRYILIVGKEEENRELREKVSILEQELHRNIETGLENERLRAILKIKKTRPDYVTSAEVFSRDPTNWFQMLWINKGKKDGIKKDMIAVTPDGPVGRIYRVLDDRANIILITDVNSSVAVRLQSSRVEGILEGRGDNRCYLKYISKEVDVTYGEKLITTGLDGIYPEGLLIGYVTGVEREGGELFQLIEVKPSLELNAVEEVSILKR